MPELPEVETCRRAIEPYVVAQTIRHTIIRETRLRWPIPETLKDTLHGQTIHKVSRCGKYILFHCDTGTLIVHFGMSGVLRLLEKKENPGKHDHVDLGFGNGYWLRYTDPRRFGAFLWTQLDPLHHDLLKDLGPEPLSDAFSGAYLYALSRDRHRAIKNLIMDSHILVGLGNIYANEALFRSRIHPHRAAKRISLRRYKALTDAIQQVLGEAIEAGGTTLRDFRSGKGKPGSFQFQLQVYGRENEPCMTCTTGIIKTRLGQRSTYHCPRCQK